MLHIVRLIAVIFATIFTISVNASTVFSFSFSDNSVDPLFNRTHVPGVVTGLLYGLSENGLDQLPTSIEITSNVAFLGMTDTVIDSNNSLFFWDQTGFNVVNGVIVSGGFGLNFVDPILGALQFRLNSEQYNLLMWNGNSGPIVGTGNREGFIGATYSSVNSSQVPEPLSLVLVGIGLAGLCLVRKISRTAPV